MTKSKKAVLVVGSSGREISSVIDNIDSSEIDQTEYNPYQETGLISTREKPNPGSAKKEQRGRISLTGARL